MVRADERRTSIEYGRARFVGRGATCRRASKGVELRGVNAPQHYHPDVLKERFNGRCTWRDDYERFHGR